jgi:HmuY protein
VNLAKAARIDVTDVTEFSSSEWDLALKRSAIRTNDGDSGPGMGGAVFLEGRDFDGVTSADLPSVTIKQEAWFSAPCKPILDDAEHIVTTFTGWYDYDGVNHTLSPHPGTFIVRDAASVIYKLVIVDFYATPDGGTGGMALGRYKLRYAKLSP